jgi:hypothetical protein
MACSTYYVIRQRNGWSVEYDGRVFSGHPSKAAAIQRAHETAASSASPTGDWRVRIQVDSGWREERSFAPKSAT